MVVVVSVVAIARVEMAERVSSCRSKHQYSNLVNHNKRCRGRGRGRSRVRIRRRSRRRGRNRGYIKKGGHDVNKNSSNDAWSGMWNRRGS